MDSDSVQRQEANSMARRRQQQRQPYDSDDDDGGNLQMHGMRSQTGHSTSRGWRSKAGGPPNRRHSQQGMLLNSAGQPGGRLAQQRCQQRGSA
eukprot:4763424-Lingulodinium_polyedra.AAC.1